MPLSSGTRLGPYEILAPLGAGGMGEVYRARDSRLGREVALKVLPADVSSDAGRRARFEQEARAAAALNHPNVVGLHDVGMENGVFYIVSELVAGATLAALIERGPVPIRKLLDIAVQIADGMASAHAARITHRDLKPANIMINPDGRAKILDFGLAKQSALSAAAGDETIAVHQTEPGMILGTVSYMSPEQARGKPADYRSDQFSFGLILYEMAAGKKAFDKPESVQTMSAILTEDPPPIETRIPPPLRWVIDRCLAKDAAGRYESSRDLFQELRSLRDHLSEASGITPAPATAAPRRRIRWHVPAAFAAGVVAALAGLWLSSGPAMPDQSAYRFTPFSFEPGGQRSPVWSPDGKSVTYAARGGMGPYQVFIRYPDSATPVQVTRTKENASPAGWTPDGKRLLLSIDREPAAIWSIATVGGEPERVMALPDNFKAGDISPDARAVALLRPGEDGRWGIWISTPPGAPLRKYTPDPFITREVYNNPSLKFSPDGKQILLFLNGDRRREESWLMPYPANPSKPPHMVLADLRTFGGTPTFSWMPDNRHIVLSLSPEQGVSAQLWIADTVSGERHALTSGTASRSSPAVSRDGQRMIFTESTGNYDVVSVDLATAATHPLISTERNEAMPAWAARQPVLVYVTDRNGPQEIWLHGPGGPDRPLVTARDFPPDTTQWFAGPALSPDADRVVYTRIERRGGGNHLWISAVAGGAPVPLTNDTVSEFPGSWSPDGSWFAYIVFRNGKVDLMKVKTTGQATPVLLKADVQSDVPAWSPAGDWIAYGERLISPDGKQERSLGSHHTRRYMFSQNGKLVYGIRDEPEREVLFSVDLATGAEKIIGDVGKDFRPGSYLNPAIRLSLSPDGKSFVYSAGKFKNNLWMLEGFASKPGLILHLH